MKMRAESLIFLSGFALYAVKLGGSNSKQMIVEKLMSYREISYRIIITILMPDISCVLTRCQALSSVLFIVVSFNCYPKKVVLS